MVKRLSVRNYVTKLREDGFLENTLTYSQYWSEERNYVVKRLPKGFISLGTCYFPLSIKLEENNNLFSLITQQPLNLNKGYFDFKLIFYPNDSDHAKIFSQSKVLHGGPQELYPGSIAVLDNRFCFNRKCLDLFWLQYSFRRNSPKKLTGSIARKYLGARNHLLNFVLDEASYFGIRSIRKSRDFCKYGSNELELDNIISDNKRYRAEMVISKNYKI